MLFEGFKNLEYIVYYDLEKYRVGFIEVLNSFINIYLIV